MEKRYQPNLVEPKLQTRWEAIGAYQYDEAVSSEIYAIDTPPPTVSGLLHLGHVYSYSHVDFMARFFRMCGRNVFYPMGFDDNGLPTEHLVEKKMGKTAQEMGRGAFIEACLAISVEAEKVYQALWQRLGLSIDWRYSYRTIDANARRISQWSFLDLFEKGHLYHQDAPTIWCPGCQTAIAQADLVDLERESEFVTLHFKLEGGGEIRIATTRPELLAACVAVFVHPDDTRYAGCVGRQAITPLFEQRVPVLADRLADPEKGTGAVMCCTFGDQTDIHWWRKYQLPMVEAIDHTGKLNLSAGKFAGLTVVQAREQIKDALNGEGLLVQVEPTLQSISAHERDNVPVEYLMNKQWFIRIIENKQKWLDLGEKLIWHPESMKHRYVAWVENLNWDWCISRQRYYGIPFPVWYCSGCGHVLLPSTERLPIEPLTDAPDGPCPSCGSNAYTPEEDVLDTWATSSLTPQIVTRFMPLETSANHRFPMDLRPQAHEIIRTWTFYTIVKSHYHFGKLPWKEILISGWGIAGEGMGKISKSKGGGPMPPMEMLEKYSADAIRYWAASTAPGKDAVISEEKVVTGQKLINKLWNLARFSANFIVAEDEYPDIEELTSGDKWILCSLQALIRQVTQAMENYDYAYAKNEIEKFMWLFADNYLEMAKARLYGGAGPLQRSAKFTLSKTFLGILKLFAPFLPHITDEIYQQVYMDVEKCATIHLSKWPQEEPAFFELKYLEFGETLVAIASAVRRFKSERALSVGTALEKIELEIDQPELRDFLQKAIPDLTSVTRAQKITLVSDLDRGLHEQPLEDARVRIGVF